MSGRPSTDEVYWNTYYAAISGQHARGRSGPSSVEDNHSLAIIVAGKAKRHRLKQLTRKNYEND
jgi:hypothetical protein